MAVNAIRLVIVMATLTGAKGQEGEEEEENRREFHMMMVIFALMIVLITLLVQKAWKVGVELCSKKLKEVSEGPD